MLIICISIAFVFWLLVKLSQTYQTEKPIVIDYTLPDDQALTILPPDDMVVELEGTGWDLMYEFFSNSKVSLYFDLREIDRLGLNRGVLRSRIQEQLSSDNIRILEVNYDNLSFSLEDELSKRVPIHLNAKLSFADEYHLRDSVILNPDSVTISGPISQVQHFINWQTDSLILENLKLDASVKLPLLETAREINLSTKEVDATIRVEQFTEKSFFVPIVIRNAPDSVRIFPERIKLSCVVGLSLYNEVVGEDFQVEIDLKDVSVKEKRNSVPIELTKKPGFVKSVNFSPKSAEFFLIKKTPDGEGASSK